METHGEAIFLVEESLARISGDKFMQAFVASFSSDPAAWARTALRVVHFCGLVLGVGAATLLDLVIARFVLLRGISREHVQVIDFSSKVVTVGLGLLWFSGIGFLIHYGLFDPPKLWNPKIWAKIKSCSCSASTVYSCIILYCHTFALELENACWTEFPTLVVRCCFWLARCPPYRGMCPCFLGQFRNSTLSFLPG